MNRKWYWGAVIVVLGMLGLTVSAAEPPVDVIRMESEALLEVQLKRQVDPQKIAKEMKLPWPVTEASKTVQQIQQELARRNNAPVQKGPAAVIDEAELKARAVEKYPVAKSGDMVALQLRTGGSLKGTLALDASGVIKVGGRPVRLSALTPETLLMLDPSENQKARGDWIARERARLNSVAGTTVIGGNRKLEAELYRGAGYLRWRNQWVSMSDLLQRAVDYRREEAAKKLRPAVIQEVAGRYGFKWTDGKWEPLIPGPQVDGGGDGVAAVTAVPDASEAAATSVAAKATQSTDSSSEKSSVELLFAIDYKAPPEAADPVALPAVAPIQHP